MAIIVCVTHTVTQPLYSKPTLLINSHRCVFSILALIPTPVPAV